MFDALKNLGGLGNIGGLLAKAGEMREKMTRMQEELARKHVTGDAGAGMVTATVNGRLELIKLKIDYARLAPPIETGDAAGKTALAPGDFEMLEDLIAAAVRAAQAKAAEMMKDEMGKLAGEMGLPPGSLPGM